jgi:hypothetical protein
MFEANPILGSLQSWVIGYCGLDTVLVVTLEPVVGWPLTTMLNELMTHTLHSIVVVVDVTLIRL